MHLGDTWMQHLNRDHMQKMHCMNQTNSSTSILKSVPVIGWKFIFGWRRNSWIPPNSMISKVTSHAKNSGAIKNCQLSIDRRLFVQGEIEQWDEQTNKGTDADGRTDRWQENCMSTNKRADGINLKAGKARRHVERADGHHWRRS